MAVSKRLRYEILRRDNHACRYCGQMAPDVKLTIDHVLPVALGGKDEASNLVTACAACNAGKSATNPDAPLVADVAQTALKWQQAIELAARLAVRDYERIRPLAESVHATWVERWSFLEKNAPIPEVDALVTLSDFIARGLDHAVMKDMVDVTVGKWTRDRYFHTDASWRYFMGCCHKQLALVQEAARLLIEQGDA